MDLFQHADYTDYFGLLRALKNAQVRCQTKRIHEIQRELNYLLTCILRYESKQNFKLKKEK